MKREKAVGNEIRLSDLAVRIGARLDGPADDVVTGIAPIEEAGPGQVTFLANPKYAHYARESRASAVIATERVEGASAAFLLTENPYYAFVVAVEIFHPPRRPAAEISPRAFVHAAATLGEGVYVGPFAVVEEGARVGDRTVLYPGAYVGRNVEIGCDATVYPNVVLYEGVRVGNRAILHGGCVIGSDGFGFAPSPEGFRKFPQVGTVRIEDDVEIGANTTIDRAALGETRIGRGTKLDNLIQVGHNVIIGSDTVIAAQTGISGSARVGSRVMMGGQVGLAGHIEVDDGILLAAKSGVADSLRASESKAWSGIPAIPHGTWLRLVTLLPKIPELFRRVRRLEKETNPRGEE